MGSFNKFLSTLQTLMISNTTVCQCVFSEIRLCEKFLATCFTFMIPDATVSSGVLGEFRLCGKYLVTLLTLMILNTTVCQGLLLLQNTHGGACQHKRYGFPAESHEELAAVVGGSLLDSGLAWSGLRVLEQKVKKLDGTE
ncbi:hypothetical protein E2C01_097352 [Portunus trituberculatus]|uniref:Uncharacterized protein n=1 Tax=Portunus trituberculatus TaxID=210409 RepID=A0A5B7K5H0_PORTR|nr:hypothetical protein [Portunus trituberculatus]